MEALIVIIIIAIIVFGIYRTTRIDIKEDEVSGGAGVGHGSEHTGDEKEPRPDDQDHDEDAAHN